MRSGVPPEIGGFRYIRVLGRGGFAEVFLYEQGYPQRQVAVKVLRHDADHPFRERFREEANVMALVSAHPAIVTILGADVSADGRPYLVMEYCPYPHMGIRAREDPLSVAEALKTGIQIAGAVESAHRLGIIHRDIKPANILVTAYRHPALTDFGISATADRSMSDGVSVPWAPPEQVEGAPATVRADVYSLAATIHHLLTGHSPFGGDIADRDLTLMAERVVQHPVPPITNRPDVPPAFEQVLTKAMSKKPANRYGSALELARALQRVQHDIGLQVTQIEAMDQAVPLREVHYEDGGQTVLVAPKKSDEAPARWQREGGLGKNPLVDSGPSASSSTTGPARPRPGEGADGTRLRVRPALGQDTDRTRLRAGRGESAAPGHGRGIPVWWVAAAILVVGIAGGTVWYQVAGPSARESEAEAAPAVPTPEHGTPIEWRYLEEGACIKDRPASRDRVQELTPTWCADGHQGYLVLSALYSHEMDYPGVEELGDRILSRCTETVNEFASVNDLDPREYELWPLAPAEFAWNTYADRNYGCLAVRRDGADMYGSMSSRNLSTVPPGGREPGPDAPPPATSTD